MKRIIVTGANGQVGHELQRSTPVENCEFHFYSKEDLDILSYRKLNSLFKEINPTHLINLAAYTNVEKAEIEEDKAYQVNVIGVKNLVRVCERYNTLLIHFSTDYVFDGITEIPYSTDSETSPLSIYGKTKAQGEREILSSQCKHVIVRTSWVYGNYGQNFYLKMLQLSQKMSEINVIEDQWGSPTSTKEICRSLDKLLEKEVSEIKSGIYHFSGTGKTNWKEFAAEIFKQSKIPMIVNGILTENYTSKAKRPKNSYLSSQKFSEEFGYLPMHWKNALTEIISEKRISPIKVGYLTTIAGTKYVIASVDWAKRECVIADINDMKKYLNLKFEDLYQST